MNRATRVVPSGGLAPMHRSKAARGEARISSDPSDQMTEMWRNAPMPRSVEEIKLAIDEDETDWYQRKTFHEASPRLEELEELVSREADERVRTLAFWKAYRLKDAYVKEHIVERYEEAYATWDEKRRAFEAAEDKRENKWNEELRRKHAERVERLTLCLKGDPCFLLEEAVRTLSALNVPLARRLVFEVRYVEMGYDVDVLLPPVDTLPKEGPVVLKSGAIRMKPKSQKRLREEYATYLFSLVSYVAARLLDVSPVVGSVAVSAHAEREDKQGKRTDDYLYSGMFTRGELSDALAARVDAEDLCLEVDHRCVMTKTKIIKAIKPITVGSGQ